MTGDFGARIKWFCLSNKKMKSRGHIPQIDDLYKRHQFIPLISRVFGSHCKLRTEFFPSIYGPRASRLGNKSMEKKRGSVIYSADRKNEANKMFMIWLLPVWGTGNKCRTHDLTVISQASKKKGFIGARKQ